ncbi:capsule assembly Wzi family protein [Trichlorobacter ammonificans]|uniref:Capsule assembly Wzi family protein n=1 Tax=Trichlorobacter ammonificans TaxID=2916410 RepID=A0ABM9DAS7_9BACT|nr:capsule assembly Wzi family protein [Trichlorobacter ammonificans]CAH2032330.1 conserved exported protein of unknown function [Trichlorobacter ammonificans]
MLTRYLLLSCMLLVAGASGVSAAPLSSSNVPLDSPIYLYLEKLSGMGLITSDVKGMKPFSRAEVARQLLEAEQRLLEKKEASPRLAGEMVKRIRELIPREAALYGNDTEPRLLDFNPVLSSRLRYVYLDGVPRNYERQVHDPGNDGVFGIGRGLRPPNPYPTPAQHHGSEGTPLLEHAEGAVYRPGHTGELRTAAEGYVGRYATVLAEPQVTFNRDTDRALLTLNRGYLKVGGGAWELEVGRDSSWFGLGYRGAITLSDNARNLNMVKLSSPEPFRVGWLSWLGDMKYAVLLSQLDHTVTGGQEREPWYYAVKLISKPTKNLEIGFNLGKQAGGKGLDNSLRQYINGIFGGTSADNSNGMAGFEVRYRAPWLRNTEFFVEFSGEDTASFWPIVESYLAGFYVPMLTEDGKNDLRFEYFRGNNILYTSGTMPQGYLYHGLPLGHSQGGATEDFFVRYSHWFGARHNLALEYFYTTRGSFGRMPGQTTEMKHAGRLNWTLPVYGDIDAQLSYGIERINNLNLVAGVRQTNHLARFELRYRY